MPVSHDIRLRLPVTVFALVATACGCERASSDAPAPPSATHPAATAPATHAAARPATADGRKPGFATGRVLRQDGNPIAVEGMRVAVTVRGISDRTGQVVSYSPTVGADG